MVAIDLRQKRYAHSQLCQESNWITTRILDQCARNNFHRIRNSPDTPCFDALDGPRFRSQPYTHCHLSGPSSWSKTRVEDGITCDRHGVCEISIHFIEDVF